MDLIGKTLGRYQIVEKLGQGGMATIFKAYQPALDRYVAIKVLPAQHAFTPGFSERFEREARAVAQLDHPNILPIIDFGQEGDLSYIVMKMATGGTLQDRMNRPMDLAQAAHFIEQIASALDHAHGRGIMHRDVKPSNVLLDEEGWVQLTDFGLAKMLAGDEGLTATGVGIGTPAYMSPEQGQGLPVDQRADIYSLGVVLYEMVTGHPPYSAETPMAVVVKHIYEPLPVPRQLYPNLPEAVEGVILKALAKDPDDRYDSAGEMARALRQTLQAAAAQPAGPAQVAPQSKPSTALLSSPPPRAIPKALPQKAKRPWGWIVGGAAAALLAIAIAALLLTQGRDTQPTAHPTVQATPTQEEPIVIATLEPTASPEPSATPGSTPPPNQEARSYVEQGWTALEAGDYRAAVGHFDRAIELDPELAEAYTGRGKAHYNLGDHDQAMADTTQAIKLDPDDPTAYYYRGSAYLSLNGYDHAIADFTRAIELNYTPLTWAYNDRGVAYYRQDKLEEAIADYAQAIEIDPDYALAYYNRGKSYDELDDRQQAIADYSRAIELNPQHTQAYTHRGLAYTEQGDYDKAIADHTKVMELDPDSPNPYFNRGNAYRQQDNNELAIADYTQAIDMGYSPLSWPYNNRGLAYFYLEDYEQAIQDYTQALLIDPEYPLAYCNRGRAYAAQMDYETAIADYTEAVRLDPNYAYAYHKRGLAYHALEDYESAIADHTQAIQLSSRYVEAYYDRGRAYAEQLEFDQAIADYNQAIRLDPDNALAYHHRGLAYAGQNDILAIADFSHAIQIDPNYAAPYYFRGLAYARQGDAPKAIADLEHFLELETDPQRRADAEEKLQELKE